MRKRRGSLSLLLDKKMCMCGASMWWVKSGWRAVREEQARETRDGRHGGLEKREEEVWHARERVGEGTDGGSQ